MSNPRQEDRIPLSRNWAKPPTTFTKTESLSNMLSERAMGRHYSHVVVDDLVGHVDPGLLAKEDTMEVTVTIDLIDGCILLKMGCTTRIVRSRAAFRRAINKELEKHVYPLYFNEKGKPEIQQPSRPTPGDYQQFMEKTQEENTEGP